MLVSFVSCNLLFFVIKLALLNCLLLDEKLYGTCLVGHARTNRLTPKTKIRGLLRLAGSKLKSSRHVLGNWAQKKAWQERRRLYCYSKSRNGTFVLGLVPLTGENDSEQRPQNDILVRDSYDNFRPSPFHECSPPGNSRKQRCWVNGMLKAGVHLDVVLPPLNRVLIEISKLCAHSTILCFGVFCKFLGILDLFSFVCLFAVPFQTTWWYT